MTGIELLHELRVIERQLLDFRVDQFIKKQDDATRLRFIRLTFDLRIIIMKLTTAALADIADRLDDLSDEIESGIASLQKEIDGLKKAVQIINTLSNVIGLAARIVGLVGV